MTRRVCGAIRDWMLNVECLMFLLLAPLQLCAQVDLDALPPLAPAYGELPPTYWEQHQTAIIVLGFAVLALVIFILKIMLRPESLVILPPEVVARQALAKLQAEPEDGNNLSSLSQIVRRYLTGAFNLPNQELTTAEFCSAIAENPRIGPELAQTTFGFLRECDVRKFSPANGTTPLNAASRALALVEQAEKRLADSSAKTLVLK